MKIVVIGGTGLVGTKVVGLLNGAGHDAIAATPGTGVDIVSGEGLDEAFAGAEVVVDVANSPNFEERAALDFFTSAGANIAKAEVAAGVLHHVALSVVGTDRLQESGYFRAKLVQERLVQKSPTPYTLIRATQFFEFIRTIADASTDGGAVRLPPVKFQPIAADDVAQTIARATVDLPTNGVIEIAGPVASTLDQAVRDVLAHDADPREVLTDVCASYFGIEVDDRSLVPDQEARLGAIHLGDWLVRSARRR